MPFECEKCGASFYSETEFHEHKMRELLQSSLEANTANFQHLYDILAAMRQDIEITVILSISRRLRCSFEDACEAYAGNWETLNNYKLKKKVEEKKHEYQ